MGGWMAFLIARARPDRVKAIIGIAAAPDFTEDIYNSLSDKQKSDLHEKGYASVPNDYSTEPYHYSKKFYEEAKSHHVLNGIGIPDIPIHLIQGREDKDVLPDTPDRIRKALNTHNIDITMINDGDHRLSRPQDLIVISRVIQHYINFN
jgi:pimeloyl-ACP methyl ester carboxylesterase